MSRRWAGLELALFAALGLGVCEPSSMARPPRADPGSALAEVLPRAIERAQACLVRIQGPTGRVRSGVALDGRTVLTCLSTLTALGEEDLAVLSPSGRRLPTELAGRDLRLRVVALRVEGLPEPPALGRGRPLAPGRLCLALGAALGTPSATFGMVSATDRFQGRAFQLDAPADPGNYGGPLIDVEGNVIGLLVHVDERLGTRSGVAFGIPLERIEAALPRLRAGEILEPGWLGGRIPRLGGGEGVALRSVAPQGPLGQAGLKPGDVILSLDGRPTLTPEAFRAAQVDLVAGQRVELEYARDGVRRKVLLNCARRGR
ncbi:MAG: serine protease [Planctomycetes bacterium]|nr:serine protease [Planctomycetota bacterium]